MKASELEDYLELFELYGKDLGSAYMEPADERYRFLFEQLCRLLSRPSQFNLTMPKPFVTTAQRYLAGDEGTLAKMSDPEVRHFMLSDLHDYVELQARLSGRWPGQSEAHSTESDLENDNDNDNDNDSN